MRGMAHVGAAKRLVGDPPDGDHAAAACELARERHPRCDLTARRTAIRALAAGMRRDDVPEQDLVRETELGESAVDHGCGRFGRAMAGELALRRERNSGHARATVPGRFGNEEAAGAGPFVQIALGRSRRSAARSPSL